MLKTQRKVVVVMTGWWLYLPVIHSRVPIAFKCLVVLLTREEFKDIAELLLQVNEMLEFF